MSLQEQRRAPAVCVSFTTMPHDSTDTPDGRYHTVEYADRIVLIPIADDPLAAAREAAGDAFAETSISELREEALAIAREQAVRGHGQE